MKSTFPPVSIWRIIPQGLEPFACQTLPSSLDEASMILPQGVYTTFRTFGGCQSVIGLTDHLARLEQSAIGSARANPSILPQSLAVDRPEIRSALRQALLQLKSSGAVTEARVRISMDLSLQPGMLFLLVENLQPLPPAVYSRGVKVASSGLQRKNPRLKETNFLKEHQALRRNLPRGVFELLLFNEKGQILEGMTSNFFAVRQGMVQTAEQGVLQGITRKIVLEIIRQAGIPLRLEPVERGGLPLIDEAFITSSSRGVVPVVQIDHQVIGSGTPGSTTRELCQSYDRYVLEQAELI